MDDLMKRINEFNNAVLTDSEDDIQTIETEGTPRPIDIYQLREKDRQSEAAKTRPRGSSAVVNAAVKAVIDGDGVPGAGLAASHKKAKDDIDLLKNRGDITRAEIARQQYMDEKFIPAIEVVIRYASPDELLNSREALKALDEMAISAGSAKGYTASYVKSAYGDVLGQNLNGYDHSDDAVTNAIRRIRMLSDDDNIRAAIGLAKQIKSKIDNGENIADEDDYELISRVVSFGD